MTISNAELQQTLQTYFGYPEFRPLQREIIENILQKRDTLAIMPTGSGKSLCYQLPSLLMAGLTVVVSPLISLMEDQVAQLREWGVPALYLNSTLDRLDYLDSFREIRGGHVKLVYAAPETLLQSEIVQLLESVQVDCFVIDEAHCISEWGHDFRPEYRQLGSLRARLPEAATLAVTATATSQVRADIKQTLQITDANLFISSFDRPNLHLAVQDKIASFAQTCAFLDSHQGTSGIIYCNKRDTVDSLTAQLAERGYPVLPYHAGLDSATRRKNQQRFRYEENVIMVATIAFGMGIDKPNVRFVLHHDLPKNLESYYQQIGRAGRDGLPADCLLLYSYGDIRTIRYFMPTDDPIRQRHEEERLQTFLRFVEATECRRPPLLIYFGETYSQSRCENCDQCLSPGASATDISARGDSLPQQDLTVAAQKFLSAVKRTNQIFGAAHIINVLRGSKAQAVLAKGHEKLSTYGIGLEYTKEQWKHLASQFVRKGLLRRTEPHGSLVVTPAGADVLRGATFMGTVPGAFRSSAAASASLAHDNALFELLRAHRAKLASEREVPPYVIFHDRSLLEMATQFPTSSAALTAIYGVGQRKVEQYGSEFLPLIQKYCEANQIEPLQASGASRTPKSTSATGQQRTAHILAQYNKGVPLSEIATEMGFTLGTILKHLEKGHTKENPLAPAGLLAASNLPAAEQARVRAAFDECGTQFLKPVFEMLGETVPYEELHLWRLICIVD